MFTYIQNLLGSAPAGLEFLEYIFAGLFTCIGLFILYKIISFFFAKFL